MPNIRFTKKMSLLFFAVMVAIWILIQAVPLSGRDKLFLAAAKGDLASVQKLLSSNVGANVRGKNQTTPLMVASYHGHTSVVKSLLDAKADVNARTSDGLTALSLASQEGHVEIAKALIDAHADVNYKPSDGVSALMLASKHGHFEVVKALLTAQADVNARDYTFGSTALITASKNGHLDVVKALIADNAAVNIQLPSGETALMYAAVNGHADIVKALLAAHANVNLSLSDGKTALILAFHEGHQDIVQLIIQSEPRFDDLFVLARIYGGRAEFAKYRTNDYVIAGAFIKCMKKNTSSHMRGVAVVVADGSVQIYTDSKSEEAQCFMREAGNIKLPPPPEGLYLSTISYTLAQDRTVN